MLCAPVNASESIFSGPYFFAAQQSSADEKNPSIFDITIDPLDSYQHHRIALRDSFQLASLQFQLTRLEHHQNPPYLIIAAWAGDNEYLGHFHLKDINFKPALPTEHEKQKKCQTLYLDNLYQKSKLEVVNSPNKVEILYNGEIVFFHLSEIPITSIRLTVRGAELQANQLVIDNDQL